MSAAPASLVSPNNDEASQANTPEVPTCDKYCNQELPSGGKKLDQRPQYSSTNENLEQTIQRPLNHKHSSQISEGSSLEQAIQEENLQNQECSLVEDTVQELATTISEEIAIKYPTSLTEQEETRELGKVSPDIVAQVCVADEAVEGVRSQQSQQDQPSEESLPLLHDECFEKRARQNLVIPSEGDKIGILSSPHIIPQRQQSSQEGQLPKQDVPPEKQEAIDENSEDCELSRSTDEFKSLKQGYISSEIENEVYIGLAADRFKDNWYETETCNINAKKEGEIWNEQAWKEKSKLIPKQSKRKASRSGDFNSTCSSNIKSPRKCNFDVCWHYINSPSGCRRGQNCPWKHARPGLKYPEDTKSQLWSVAHTARRPNNWKSMRKIDLNMKSQGLNDQHPSDKTSLELRILKSSVENLKKRNTELVKRNYFLDCENKELKNREKGKEKVIEELREENYNLKRLLEERERPRSQSKCYRNMSNPRSLHMPYSHPPRRLLYSKDCRFDVGEDIRPINDRRHYTQPLPPQKRGVWSRPERKYNPRHIPSFASPPHNAREWPYRESAQGACYRYPEPPSFVEGGSVRSYMDPRSSQRDLEGYHPNTMPRHRNPGYFPIRVPDAALVRKRYVEENYPTHPHLNHHPPSPSSNASPPPPHGWGSP